MFCKIRRLRNVLLAVVFFGIGFFVYQNFGREVILANEETSISTKEQGPAIVLLCDLNKKQDQSYVQNSIASMVRLGKIGGILKGKVRVVAVVNTDYENGILLAQLKSIQRHF